MKKKLIFKCICVLFLFPFTIAQAKDNTEIEAFVRHVKETNTFVTINNIWSADNSFDKSAILEKVEKAQPLVINYDQIASLMKQKTMAINLVIPGTGGISYSIEMARYEFLSNDFQVHTLGENNKDELFNYTPGLYYRGVVGGIAGSVAAFSFFNNEVYGIFSIPGEGNYVVVPNTMGGNHADYNQHYILYNDNDLKIKQYAPKCATDQLPMITDKAARTTTTVGNEVYNSCTEVRVFEVGDYALFRTKSSITANVTNYLTALFNNQSTLYRNEGIPIVLKYVQINTATDNYQHITTSNSSLFLDTFGKVTQNTLHGCDLALLASTALNGGYGALGGVAWLQAMCASYNSGNFFGPYGFVDLDNSGVTNFPTYSWDVEVITHEMGHIVGSPHTHRCCWNPPGTGTTAIDGCYTIEGSCAAPAVPLASVGGTIMSYCHLTSSGINFSNGFGQQPGDTIRYFVNKKFSSSCGAHYNPSTALAIANRTISANRECTDIASGDTTTYYWKDNNTADQADDTLVLMIKKHGNNIGNLNTSGFSVTASTTANYGSGTGDTVTFPAGTSGVSSDNYSMRRYWKITPTSNPTTAVEVVFPFLQADTLDVNGSAHAPTTFSNYIMYKVNTPYDPNPASGFSGALPASFSFYSYGTSPSSSNWSFSTTGPTYFAHMMMTNLSGGGTGFYSTNTISAVRNVSMGNDGIYIYPNPASSVITIEANGLTVSDIRINDIQGRSVLETHPRDKSNTVVIPVNDFVPGLYFVQIHTEQGTTTQKITVLK